MKGIIDFHTHPLYDFHRNDHGVDIDLKTFKDDLQLNGVTHACGSVICRAMNGRLVSDYERMISELNSKAYECQQILGAFYTPGIHVHPAFVQMSCEEIDRARERNVRLIGELVPYMMGWRSYSTRGMLEIFEYAAEKDMVVSLHPTTMADMDALATFLPHLQIVYAHLTGTDEELELMRKHDNVFYDYSAHGKDFEGMLRHSIDRVGKDRILYGTDFPGANPVSDKAVALASGLTSSELEALFHLNARRLLGVANGDGNNKWIG